MKKYAGDVKFKRLSLLDTVNESKQLILRRLSDNRKKHESLILAQNERWRHA